VPIDDAFSELEVSQLPFYVHVENLKDVSLSSFNFRLQGHDVLLEVHDAAIDNDSRAADNVEFIEEFDDGDLGEAVLVGVADGDVTLGLEVGDVELEELGIEAEVGEVLNLTELERDDNFHLYFIIAVAATQDLINSISLYSNLLPIN
jgi:hypothetical protein